MANNIPWNRIKLDYETRPGITTYDLAKRYPVTRQGIERRAKAEGWVKATHEALELAKSLPIANHQPQGSRVGLRSPENIAQAIEIYKLTGNLTMTAGAIGVSPDTLRNWMKEDPEFSSAMSMSRQQKLGHWVGVIDGAADRGDWKAADRLLQTAPETRTQFTGDSKTGGVTVVLNISREPVTEGVTIDGHCNQPD